MDARHYAEALFLATRDKREEEARPIVERLLTLLQENRHERLLRRIIHSYEALVRTRSAATYATVTYATHTDQKKEEAHIDADLAALGAHELPRRVQVDRTLVGGYHVEAQGSRIDRSHKATLLALYRHLTNHR